LAPRNDIQLLFVKNELPYSASEFDALLRRLPAVLHPAMLRFERWQDRQASLLGKLLLQEALLQAGADQRLLSRLTVNAFGRPCLPASCGLDFNISHTTGMVVCALSAIGPVGIDVDYIRPADTARYRFVFSAAEWDMLEHNPDRDTTFYTVWTKKEAAIKAAGGSVYGELSGIDTCGCSVVFGEHRWRLMPVALEEGWVCHLATLEGREPVLVSARLELAPTRTHPIQG
jgi:4'-phosphopantetheinyl transferase